MNLQIEKNVSLKAHTTLRVGGLADYFVIVRTVEELKDALQFAKQTAVRPLVIGGGSNVLVNDSGYRGLVIKNAICGLHCEPQKGKVMLMSGAGESLDEVIVQSVLHGYWGLENLSAIPGTVGATPIQNVGAYGVEVSDLVHHVTAIHVDTEEVKVFTNQECEFSYRDSFFKTEEGRSWIVTEVAFELSLTPTPQLAYGSLNSLREKTSLTPAEVSDVVRNIRSQKFPDWKQVGTAGSFFKNPIISKKFYQTLCSQYSDLPSYELPNEQVKIPLGWVLDNICQLRGYSLNGVSLYQQQALVLVAEFGVSAKEIDEFANHIANIVEEKTNIKIEREVRSV